MSNAILPALAGVAWDSTVSPQFRTKIHESVSGFESRAAFRQSPLWKFALKYDLLRDNVTNNELRTLLGFFNARQGSFDSFLYSNPSDSAVVAESFGVGDGATKIFQITRGYGGYAEAVCNISGSPLIYQAGVLKSSPTEYSVSATGLVTFITAPPVGAALTWSGSFYYRCRFLADSIDPVQFMRNMHSLGKFEFIGSTTNKIL